MQGDPKRRRAIAALAAGYLCFGLAWILLSDALLGLLLLPEQMQRLSTVKGVLFVLLTTGFWTWAAHHIGTLTPDPMPRQLARREGLAARWLALLAACMLPLLALLLRQQLAPLAEGRPVFLLFMLPIVLAALLGGLTAGLLATLLSGLLTALWTPDLRWSPFGWSHLDSFLWVLMLSTGVVISLLSAVLLRSLRRERRHRLLIDAVIDGSPDAIWVRDPQGQVLLANQVAQQQQGVLEGPLSPLEQATLGDGHVHNVAATRRLRDGPLHHLLLTVGPVPDAQGGRQGVFSIARDVTELRDSLAVLSRSQLALAEAQQLAHMGSWEIELPDGQPQTSAELRRLLGLPEGQLLHSLSELARCFEPSDEFEGALERALAAGESYQGDLQLRRPDGSRAWVTARLRVDLDRNGRPARLSGALQDISARKRAELALAEREQQLRRVLEGSDQGYWDWDLSSDRLQVSENLERLLGYPEGQLHQRGTRWADFVHPEDLPVALAAVERHKSGATPHYQAELRCETLDRRWRRLSVRGRVLERDAQGRALSMAGTFNDITERHELELALCEAQTVFDRSDEGIMFCDAELRITKVNPALCAITGYSPSEVIGQTPRLFSSGRHDAAFYAGMWASLKQHGRWRGEIWNQRKNGEVYAEILSISVVRDAEGAVLHYIAVFTDVSLLKRHEEELERMLHYDPLTGVANRRLLTDRLQQALARARRSGKPLAVCLLDLDGFRQANERHGEDAGNRLLVGVAQHLQSVLRADDTLARLGGDEFVLLLTELHSTQECLQVLDRVLSAARLPVVLGEGLQLGLSASVGVTLFPADDVDPDTLLRHADQAMFQAKDAGRDRYQLFDPEAERRAQAQRSELQRLQQAYEAGEFVLFYQPKIELADGRLAGAEALIRWQHPERGLLPPGEFLPYLPGSALELPLGQWVLEQAWDQAARWHAQGAALCVGVNISAHELLAPGFAERLAATLARQPGVPPALLELEVLESAAIGDMAQAVAVMRECRTLGVRFALDDFGTGYSSLSYLRQLPVDVIKVDQSFIRNMLSSESDLEIVVGVIGLARAFHLEAVAEGVETLEHAQALRRMGCQLAQGYGIARPLPLAQFEAWRAQWQGLPSDN